MTRKRISKLNRKFRGIPVREARASMHVQPTKADISGAVREDPENCAYAQCLKRVMECQAVFIFRTIAYVQTLNENGAEIMERYTVKTYAREYILRFDHGEKVGPGGFVLHRPSRSSTLDYKLRQDRERRRSGHATRGVPATKPKEFSLKRSGTGKVHFFGAEDIQLST
jgi:hypothetical protein